MAQNNPGNPQKGGQDRDRQQQQQDDQNRNRQPGERHPDSDQKNRTDR